MLKILSYTSEPFKEFQLGFATVELKQKVVLQVKLCKAKSGNIFCAFPSLRIAGQWVPTFSLHNKEEEKKLLNSICDLVKPLMNTVPPPPLHKLQPEPEDNMPF